MNREQWLAERMKGIGASEAAAVLGVSPWSSPVDVWARKRGLIPEIEDNERLRTGRLFEEPIAQLYAEREKVAPRSNVPRDLRKAGSNPARQHARGDGAARTSAVHGA